GPDCEAPDRDDDVDHPEPDCVDARARVGARREQPDHARRDVDDVVPAVHRQDPEDVAVDGLVAREVRVVEEADDPRDGQDRADAEDIVQEAFLSVWRSAVRYQPERGNLRSWLLSVVHNRAIDWLRRPVSQDRGRVDAEGIEERKAAPELTDSEAFRREEAQTVRAAMER